MRVVAASLLLATGCHLVFELEDDPRVSTFPGLVARYSLDAVVGSAIPDESGNGHDAVCIASACPTQIDGPNDQALHFDGTQIARTPPINTLDTLNTTSGFTVSLWITMDEIPPLADDGFACAVSKPYLAGAAGFLDSWQACYANAPVQPEAVFFGSATPNELDPINLPGTKLEIGRWYHLALIWDGVNERTLYVDGVIVNTRSPAIPIPFDATELVLGGDFDGPPLNTLRFRWRGSIDEIQVYNRKLELAELAELATAATPR